MEAIDIIVPSLKTQELLAPLIDELRRSEPDCRIIPTCLPASASVNRNHGLNQATTELVAMVDDDMEQFPFGWAQKLAKALRSQLDCVMIAPQLAKPDGSPSYMMGGDRGSMPAQRHGISMAPERKLPTACIVFRNDGLRFDENFRGSGFEDDDFAKQLCERYPRARFLVYHELWIAHRHEQKNQRGDIWKFNEAYFKQKWKL